MQYPWIYCKMKCFPGFSSSWKFEYDILYRIILGFLSWLLEFFLSVGFFWSVCPLINQCIANYIKKKYFSLGCRKVEKYAVWYAVQDKTNQSCNMYAIFAASHVRLKTGLLSYIRWHVCIIIYIVRYFRGMYNFSFSSIVLSMTSFYMCINSINKMK